MAGKTESATRGEMTVLAHQDVCSHFLERVRRAPERLLLLDYDGTLAPFTPERMHAVPYRDVPELVSRIMQCGTRVVLITGRRATDLLSLMGIEPHPEIWGSHGIERLHPDGSYEIVPLPERHTQGLKAAEESLRSKGLEARLESKPGGLAVHWRGLSSEDARRVEAEVSATCQPLSEEYGLALLPFDGGLELRSPARHKGDAVSAILAESHSDAAVAYLGDDQTDENAFRAIKGRGIAVLVRPDPRPSMADVWLRPPEELSRFFRDWLWACGAHL
jgi:trehalose 6-phosphate phosphatase